MRSLRVTATLNGHAASSTRWRGSASRWNAGGALFCATRSGYVAALRLGALECE
jgi:hypothetical protein